MIPLESLPHTGACAGMNLRCICDLQWFVRTDAAIAFDQSAEVGPALWVYQTTGGGYCWTGCYDPGKPHDTVNEIGDTYPTAQQAACAAMAWYDEVYAEHHEP